MKKTCVIGWPIAHSRSPIIHNYWLKQHSIESIYEKHAVSANDLGAFVKGLPKSEFLGCNVTIPHKEQAFEFVDVADARVRRLGAANTLYVRDGKVHATNTDGEGFIASLRQDQPNLDLKGANIVVLGAGGAAKSIIDALLSEDVRQVSVINRTMDRIVPLQQLFGSKLVAVEQGNEQFALESADVLVNTTSLGMEHQPPLSLDISGLKNNCLVTDIVYTPLKTELLKAAEAKGHPIVKGLGMLLHQAVRGFELWYGVKPVVSAELITLVEADVLKAGTK